MPRVASILCVISAAVSVACGGSSGPSTQPSPVPSPTPAPAPAPSPAPAPAPAPSPSPSPLQPTFTSVNTRIFQVWCTACHTNVGRAPEGGLRLDASVAYAQLVNVSSAGKPGAVRVVPGNPDGSYVIQKLEGRSDIVGSRMPLGGPFLPQSDINIIRTWIAQGAPNN